MANKLFLVSATLAFFFLLTNASIYRTVVEFDEDDATNPIDPFRPFGPKLKCRKEFQQAQHLRACQQWMHHEATQSGGGPGLALDDEFDPQERPQQLQQCCNELRREEQFCVCPTLKRAARAVSSRLQDQEKTAQPHPQMISRIFQTARNLPNVCKVPQVSACHFKQAGMPSYPPYY